MSHAGDTKGERSAHVDNRQLLHILSAFSIDPQKARLTLEGDRRQEKD
jgi:hypothetical protein